MSGKLAVYSHATDPTVQPNAQLPTPSAEALEASRQLTEQIRAAIDAGGGRITFSRYMELALYTPGLGYYSGGSRKFGAEGDFVTAPEISPLFSRCLARQSADVLEELGRANLLEFGAGSGLMAATILAELERLACLPARYQILDLSGELRQRQRETIVSQVPHLLERVEWLDRLPEAGWRGVVLANEVVDAMPVERFVISTDGPRSVQVGWDSEGFVDRFDEFAEPTLSARVAALAEQFGLPAGYQSEINLAAEGWLAGIAEFLAAGAVFVIDYGFPAHEYYHPQRHMGTLMCHYRHRGHGNPYLYPGLQDITSHVDFTALAEMAVANGLQVRGFANQANFLLACGLTELAEAEAAHGDPWQLAGQIKRLTLPGEMGELFKVLGLTRGVERPLRGFALRDDRNRL